MTMTDPIADMLSRIRNGQMAGKEVVNVPTSKVKRSVLELLKAEGYITDVKDAEGTPHPELAVELKYMDGKPVISEIKRVSRPGLRQYTQADAIPTVRNGLGTAVVSTSKGVLSDTQAREQGVGGEVLCTVF